MPSPVWAGLLKAHFLDELVRRIEDKHGKQFIASRVVDRGEFWWNERKPDQPSLWDSEIRLGEDFFNEIISHPVPIDMNTLTALKRSPLGLDLYLWLTYRTFALRAPLRLSWQQVYRQFGVEPDRASDKVTVQAFRRKVLRELKKIKLDAIPAVRERNIGQVHAESRLWQLAFLGQKGLPGEPFDT